MLHFKIFILCGFHVLLFALPCIRMTLRPRNDMYSQTFITCDHVLIKTKHKTYNLYIPAFHKCKYCTKVFRVKSWDMHHGAGGGIIMILEVSQEKGHFFKKTLSTKFTLKNMLING